jgi:GNAT superfamily N-acetyltransferase
MKNSKPDIISKVATHKEIQFLEDMLYKYNSAKTKRADGKLFSKLIYNTRNNIIAGITGWVWASACEITLIWVKDDYRKKGYGQILLKAAEEEAKKEKCKKILLRTYSFQAPYFYLKYGYKIENEIKDFPYGHSYFCLTKKVDD